MQAAARRRYLPYGEFVGILYHEAEMLACKGIFAQPSNCTATRKCIKRQSRSDFAAGKIPSIFNHEVKMLACKGIFTRPSMSHRAATCRTGGTPPPILAIRRVRGNIIPRSENVCSHRHFREAVNVTSCGNLPHGRRSAADTCHSAGIMGILYHEAKMCARTDIFARPSIAQPRESAEAAKPL